MIQKDMAQRELDSAGTAAAAAAGGAAHKAAGTPKRPKEAVKIRLDAGEWELLQAIAEQQGTKASILIRQAVKQIIKKSGSGL
jgi:uncharacterized protein (DUF4415 family)